MSTRSMMVSVFSQLTGFDLIRHSVSARQDRVLRRLAALAGPVGTVIDVGASNGQWSAAARRIWPDTDYLLIEAQDVHRPALAKYQLSHSRARVENAAASDHTGSLAFLADSPFGGTASEVNAVERATTVKSITVDSAVEKHKLTSPFLLKLDTHGHEAEILSGATKVLLDASLLFIEAYNFPAHGRMTFWELCVYLERLGFRPAGMAEPMVRPKDSVFWQVDIAFLPSTHSAFTTSTWE